MFWYLIGRNKGLFKPLIEAMLRARDNLRLTLLFLTGRSTVLQVLKPEALSSGKIVIFATFPAEFLSDIHVRLLKKFEARGYSILVVSNHPRAGAVLGPLLTENWTFVFRRPFGRDFGCFKDCAKLIYERVDVHALELKRVVLLNDSVMTLQNTEQKIVDHLDDAQKAFAGVTENYEFAHHVGSFMVAMSAPAFCSKRVRRFWRKYRPISTRQYSIHRGEFGLTKSLKKAGYEPHVLFTVSEMKRFLQTQDFESLDRIFHSMQSLFLQESQSFISKMDARMKELIGEFNEDNSASRVTVARPSRRFLQRKLTEEVTGPPGRALYGPATGEPGHEFDQQMLRLVRYRERFLGASENTQSVMVTRRVKDEIINSIVAFVFRGSQIHHAAAILLFMGAGIVKKDVVFRQIVEPFNLDRLLADSSACASDAEARQIMHEILVKGHPYSLRGLNKLLYNWGFI